MEKNDHVKAMHYSCIDRNLVVCPDNRIDESVAWQGACSMGNAALKCTGKASKALWKLHQDPFILTYTRPDSS